MSHFNQPNTERKNLSVDNKVRESIGDVYCPTFGMKSVFTFQRVKGLVSTTVKSAKPAATF